MNSTQFKSALSIILEKHGIGASATDKLLSEIETFARNVLGSPVDTRGKDVRDFLDYRSRLDFSE